MSAQIEVQRRVEIKTMQTEAALQREQTELGKLERERAKVEKLYLAERKSFDHAKQKLLASKNADSPGRELQRSQGFLQSMRERGRALIASRLHMAQVRQQQIDCASKLNASRILLERLSDRGKSVLSVARRKHEEAECEGQFEIKAAAQSLCATQLLRAETTANTPVSSGMHVVPNAGRFAQQISDLRSADSAFQSKVGFVFRAEDGARLEVNLVRRGDRSLEVRLVPDERGDKKRLWRRREEIYKALGEAGYTVERFVVCGGNGA